VALLVTARTREIGLRRALGARRGQVVGQIVFEAFLMAAVGMLAGLVLTAGIAFLLGMRAADFEPRIVITGAAVAFALPLVSSWIPARRAARIPMAIAGKVL
jgi:putative ABC transport system permease protein